MPFPRQWFLAFLALCTVAACRHEAPPAEKRQKGPEPTSSEPSVVVSGTPKLRDAAEGDAPERDAGIVDSHNALSLDDPEKYRVPEWTDEALAKRLPAMDGPRYYAKNRHVWIYSEPDISTQWIGFLWTGGSVRLKNTTPVNGKSCSFYYAILPRGYVCSDGNKGTIDPNDKLYRQLLRFAPRTDSPWMHRYGQVRELTRYLDFPPTRRLSGDSSEPDTEDVLDFRTLPPSIHEAHKTLPEHSTVAYTTEIHRNGRNWLLTSDYTLIAKEKLTEYPNSGFHGVVLNDSVKLPLAFFRGNDRPRYTMTIPGHFEPMGKNYPRLSWVQLTGHRQRADDTDWLEANDGGWVRASDATIPTPRSATPWGAPIGSSDVSPTAPQGRATWIEVSIQGGWLIAYEGTQPRFTTLISPGSGGLPRKGQAPIDTFATPLGRFQINGKFSSSTMIGLKGLIHSEVPFAQNFSDLYSIHVAYWHDNWGYPMSGGCINVSPIDGYYLFHWTEPEIPEGWYGVRWIPSQEPSTMVIIHH